jgi:hypothetical protein
MGYLKKKQGEEWRCTATTRAGTQCKETITIKCSNPRKCSKHITALERLEAAERWVKEAGDAVLEAHYLGEIPFELLPQELYARR